MISRPLSLRKWSFSTRLTGMTAFWKKLFRLKHVLRWWNRWVFDDIFQCVRDVEERVDQAEINFESDPTLEQHYYCSGHGLIWTELYLLRMASRSRRPVHVRYVKGTTILDISCDGSGMWDQISYQDFRTLEEKSYLSLLTFKSQLYHFFKTYYYLLSYSP